MNKRITIEELQSYLWNSAVLLRTNIDAGAYKQYIFPLLFFKRICDVYDEETAAAQEEYGEDAAAALSLYVQLDRTDRLRINERMQTLLEDEKYTSQKAKRGQSPA